MKKILFVVLGFILVSGSAKAQNDAIASELSGDELISFLESNYSVTSSLSYNAARDNMFEDFDIVNGGVRGVYSGFTYTYQGTPDRIDAQNNGFNTEHTWPQSFFDQDSPMRTDIHHLFITRQDVNGARSNYRFDEIPDQQTSIWYYLGQNQSSIPTSNIDEYSEVLSNTSFEPREDFKGNIARAIYYFWTVYQNNSSITTDGTDNAAFFEEMRPVLLQWHDQDPVDEAEVQRSLNIERVQGNRNPFIHDTTLVRRAYYGGNPIIDEQSESILISLSDYRTIELDWTTNSDPSFDVYVIRRSENKRDYSIVDSLSSMSAYSDIVDQYNSKYYYLVTAVANNGSVITSAKNNIRTGDEIAPLTPTDFTLDQLNGQVQLNWTPNEEEDLLQYYVYKGKDSLSLKIVDSVLVGSSSYIDGNIFDGDIYYYSISAVDSLVGNPSETFNPANESERTDTIKVNIDISTSIEEPDALPSGIQLDQNYPNPFNPTTNIAFMLNQSREVSLKVYSRNGRLVQTLTEQNYPAGSHTVSFDGSGLSSGVYYYVLRAGSNRILKKMTLIK